MANNDVYDFLTRELPGELDWNFVKFLIGRDGTPLRRYPSIIAPNLIRDDIELALAGQPLGAFPNTTVIH